jgi:hypothetical protein
LVCDGGINYDITGRISYVSQITSQDYGGSFYSKEIDMGTAKDKVIHGLSAFCGSTGRLIIDTDSTSLMFAMKKGANVKRMNIPSSKFTFIFYSGEGFFVDQLKIEYRIKGD